MTSIWVMTHLLRATVVQELRILVLRGNESEQKCWSHQQLPNLLVVAISIFFLGGGRAGRIQWRF